MVTQTVNIRQLRAKLRQYIDRALSGNDVLIERYGEPVAVLIPVEDYQQIQGELECLRSARQVEAEKETLMDDPQALRALYAEFGEQDRQLAQAGLSHYGRLLAEEEGGAA